MLTKTLDWIDERPPWQFLLILYVARWVVLVPVLALDVLFTESQRSAASVPMEWSQVDPLRLFLVLVVLGPLLETLVECTLPYWILSHVPSCSPSGGRRPWCFIIVSACVMTALHPILAALLPAFITGTFLAYCYAHFAPLGAGRAILATTLFHAAINLVGWTMLILA